MSSEYLMFRPEHGLAPEAAADEAAFEGLGSADQLTGSISRVFPSVQWKASTINAGVVTGGPAPEFLLNAEVDGQVHSFTMSRADASQVRQLSVALRLSAFDMESGEVVQL